MISWHLAVIGFILYCYVIHAAIAVTFYFLPVSSIFLSTYKSFKFVVGWTVIFKLAAFWRIHFYWALHWKILVIAFCCARSYCSCSVTLCTVGLNWSVMSSFILVISSLILETISLIQSLSTGYPASNCLSCSVSSVFLSLLPLTELPPCSKSMRADCIM
jgi:hypothetical protein